MPKFKLSMLSLALAASGLTALPSYADQEAVSETKELSTTEAREKAKADASIETIEIKGFRRSLYDSLNEKRYSDVISESVSADDLGSLPDVSIADALARLPGVTAVRTGGQAGALNIRGLSGDFVFATLNGREQVSPSGSRTVEFDQFPSELISQASVYKSPKASLIEGGVAGSIEMKTASPLAKTEDHSVNLNVRGSFNDRADQVPDATEYGNRISGSYTGKFLDETLGFAVGYSRLFQPSVATQFVGLQYNGGTMDTNADGTSEVISEGFELQHLGGEETRDGYMTAIEWRPNSAVTVKGDVFYSEFKSEEFARGFRVKTLNNGNITNGVVADGAMIGGTVSRIPGRDFLVQTTNDDNSDTDKVLSTGLNVEWMATDQLTLTGDISTSQSDSNFVNGVNWSLAFADANAANPVIANDASVTYLLNGLNVPSVAFNRDYTDLDSVMMAKIGIYPYVNSDEVNALRFDGKYDLQDSEFFSSVEAGVRYSEREARNDRSVFEFGNDFGNYAPGQGPLKLTDDMVREVNFSGEFAGLPSYLAIDLNKALDAWLGAGNYTPQKDLRSDWTFLNSNTVNEDVTAAYVQGNLDTEMFGVPVTGNLGLRVVRTDQSSTGYLNVGQDTPETERVCDEGGRCTDNFVLSTRGHTFTKSLPSVNLNFILTDDDQIRFAAAKVMGRPPIADLAAGGGSWIDGGKFNVWSRGPDLEPFMAKQVDLSYEHYFEGDDGAISFAIFNKDIESFVQTTVINNPDFDALGIPMPEFDPQNPGQALVPGVYETKTNNAKGGYIRGFEAALTKTFSFLPGIWSGLGTNLSYSYTKSEIEQTNNLSGTSRTISLPGLSPKVISATLYFDYDKFSTRVSARYRDAFIGEQVAVETQLAYYSDETVMDYQASYKVTENLDVLFQVNNLTDEPTKTYFGNEAQTGTLQYFGRQYYFGVNYSM